MIDYGYAAIIVVVCALMTIGLRAMPFVFFGGKRGIPRIVERLGQTLPPAIMAALVVYCLKSAPYGSLADGAKQLAAAVVVALLHLWKHNTFLSVGGGTLLYMLLIRIG